MCVPPGTTIRLDESLMTGSGTRSPQRHHHQDHHIACADGHRSHPLWWPHTWSTCSCDQPLLLSCPFEIGCKAGFAVVEEIPLRRSSLLTDT